MVNDGNAIVKTSNLVKAGKGQPTYRNPGSIGQPLLGFETRYAEARRKAGEAKAKRKQGGKDWNSVVPDPDTFRYQQEAITLRLAVRERLKKGYELAFDQHIAGRWRKAFREEGLRSEENPILKLFVTLVPKGGRARASNDKATLDIQSRSKLLTLDYPYIELNKQFLGAIRIDCDGVFSSPKHLLLALEESVREGKIPCLPHIIVGDLLDDGTYHRPHFIFLLPPGTAVWKADDPRCRRDIVRLFLGVSNGLTKALIPLGADPAAPATTMRMKNPLSPLWHTMTPNQHTMPSLSDYAQHVDTGSSREALARQAAVVQSGMGLKASNMTFNMLREQAVRLLVQWHFTADKRMKGSKAALADHLHIALEEHANTMEMEDARVSYVVAKVADRLAMDFDPAKLQGGKNRQRLLHVVEGMTNVRDRQRAGADYSHGVRRERSLEKLVTAYAAMLERSETLSPERLASLAGVSRSTAYRHFSACQQICASGCIDKKGGIRPNTENPEKTKAETTTAISMDRKAEAATKQKDGFDEWDFGSTITRNDDLHLTGERDALAEAQEGQISDRQMHMNALDVSHIIFDNCPHLVATQTLVSNVGKKAFVSAGLLDNPNLIS